MIYEWSTGSLLVVPQEIPVRSPSVASQYHIWMCWKLCWSPVQAVVEFKGLLTLATLGLLPLLLLLLLIIVSSRNLILKFTCSSWPGSTPESASDASSVTSFSSSSTTPWLLSPSTSLLSSPRLPTTRSTLIDISKRIQTTQCCCSECRLVGRKTSWGKCWL